MANPETTTHGAPVWIDLGTPDFAAATQFYGELFGWAFEDRGDNYGHYHFITLNGEIIGGAMATNNEYSGWNVYLGVDEIEQAVQRTVEFGGAVIMPPMQVGDKGAMAIVADPAGAVVGMWTGDLHGAHTTETPGLPCWFEAMTTDFDDALTFYREVFGWQPTFTKDDGSETTEPPTDGFRYATNFPRADVSAGLCDAAAFIEASYWRTYVLVDDADATAEQVKQLGGTVLDGPQDSPFGRLYTVADPHGGQLQVLSS